MTVPPWHAAARRLARTDALIAIGDARAIYERALETPVTLRVAVVDDAGELLADELVAAEEPMTVRLRRRSREPPARQALDVATVALIALGAALAVSVVTVLAYVRLAGLDC